MGLMRNLVRPTERRSGTLTFDQFGQLLNDFFYNGTSYLGLQETWQTKSQGSELAGPGLEGICRALYKRNGILFACQVARLKVFAEARLMFQAMLDGRPGDLFGAPSLSIFDEPWPTGQTGDLLSRMIQDADLAGNAFIRRSDPRDEPRLERLRPDWVTIVLGIRPGLVTPEFVGVMYEPDGPDGTSDPAFFDRSEIAHWAPTPDPESYYRGMSWLQPIVREAQADSGFTDHKKAFLEHAATPNMVVSVDKDVTPEKFKKFKELMDEEHKGFWNAWKTLYLGGGADAKVVGVDFEKMDLRRVQGALETRIAAAAGTPPIVVGLSEGLEAATYSNYAQARRAFADTTVRQLWRSAAGALQPLVALPPPRQVKKRFDPDDKFAYVSSRLWFDTRDIQFLQEDRKDAAEIAFTQAQTIGRLVQEGYEPVSVVAAVEAEDWNLLKHSGKVSVQLYDPDAPPANENGSTDPTPTTGPDEPTGPAGGQGPSSNGQTEPEPANA